MHDPASPLEDTASSLPEEGPRLLVVQAGPSSAYNTRSQGSAPAINVIGEPLQQPQQQHRPLEPLPSDSDSVPDASPAHQQAQPSQPDQLSNRDLFFSDLVHEAAGAQPHHSAPPAPHRPVFGSPHFPPAAPYPASPLAQQLFYAAPTTATPAAVFSAPVPSPPLVYGQTPQLGPTAPYSSAVSSSDALLDAALLAESRLPPDMRQAFDLLRMDMDTMQAALRGDIRDLRRHTVSPSDLQHGFAAFVQDMESQLSQQNRSAVEQSRAVRNVQAQFNTLQEHLYGRAHDLRAHLDQRLAAIADGFLAHQQATEELIRSLHSQFQAEFYQNHTAGMQSLRGMLEQLLADLTQSTAPVAAPSPAPTAQSAPARSAPHQEVDLLGMDIPAASSGIPSAPPQLPLSRAQ